MSKNSAKSLIEQAKIYIDKSLEINKKSGKGGRQGERVYDITSCGPTICASSGGPGAKTGLYDFNGKIRKLSIVETLKMFGFNETYKFESLSNKNDMLFYLGNSIVVNVIEELIKENLLLREENEKLKLLYTAITRSSNKLHIFY